MWTDVGTAAAGDEGKDAASTHKHISLLLRHYSRTHPPTNLTVGIFLYPPNILTHSPSPPLHESQGSLHLLQDAANHLRVRACV